MDDVPVEILRDIFGRLPLKAQMNCSLVRKAWTGECQSLIFRSISVSESRGKGAKDWLKLTEKERDRLMDIAHELSCTFVNGPIQCANAVPYQVFFGRDLPKFKRLDSLELTSGRLPVYNLAVFAPHQTKLRVLKLSQFDVTTDELIDFVNYFTNLKTLQLTDVKILNGSGHQDLRPRSLQKLSVCHIEIGRAGDHHLDRLFQGISSKDVKITADLVAPQFAASPSAIIGRVQAHVEVLELQCVFCMYNDRPTILPWGC